MRRQFSFHPEAFLKSLILLGFSMFLFWLVASNEIVFYINPRFVWLTKSAAALIFLMFLIQAGNSFGQTASAHDHGHAGRGGMKLVLLPFVVTLLMAFLLPHQALDASMANNKGVNLGTRPAASGQSGSTALPGDVAETQTNNNNGSSQGLTAQAEDPVQLKIAEIRKSALINMNEDNFTLITNEVNIYPDRYVGKEITMLGFIFKGQDYPPNQFGLVRYVIACCSADAVPDGFMCECDDAPNFGTGEWLNIRGTIKMGQYENSAIPVIKVASFSKAQEPQNPYIYPFFINTGLAATP